MGKIRKILVGVLAVCMTACAGVALAACEDDYPDYKNPTSGQPSVGGDENADNRYTIKVQSMGGLGLDNVQINLTKGGASVVSGISNNGEIVVYADPDDYGVEIVESSLPAGYYMPETVYTTGENKEVTVNIPSGIISSTASSGTVYSLGDVAYDFSFTDVYDESHLLSELVKDYKAVVLNFFFTSCGPCNSEFPALHEAYKAFNDRIAVVAIADETRDSWTAVKNYNAQQGFTFHVTRDEGSRLHSLFSVNSWPTTFIIDRYGVIAYGDAGSQSNAEVWRSLFARYTADNYVQDIEKPDDGDEGETKENIKPYGVTESDYALMPAQIAPEAGNKVVKFETETNEKDKEYNWPWIVENDEEYTYLTASNSGQDPSFSIIYLELDLVFGDMVSFDYRLNSLDGYDMFIVIVNGTTPLLRISGDSKGWQTMKNIYVANTEERITLSFTYIKYYSSQKTPLENDYVRIKNISVVNVEDTNEATDVARTVFYEDITPENIVLNPQDGYYYISGTGNKDYDGALVLIDLWTLTPWSEEHTGSYSFSPEDNGSYYSSMYWISYWLASNHGNKGEEEPLAYNYLSADDSDYLNELLNLQNYSENGYLPVTERLKNILVEFSRMFNKTSLCQKESEDNDWIEMCYFYQHYNSENFEHWDIVEDEDGNEHRVPAPCYVHDDPVKGMTFHNAFTAVETFEGDENPFPNHADIKTAHSYNGGGVYFKFTPTKSGVYKFNSRYDTNTETDPELFIHVPDGNGGYRYVMSIEDNLSYDAWEKSGITPVYKPNGEYEITYKNLSAITDFYGFMYLEQGQTIYLQVRHFMMGAICEFDFSVEYVGESYDWLRACSISGAFIGITDENDQIIDYTYHAIPVAYDAETDTFYSYENNEFGSPIYIDFLHANYFDILGNSIKDMIDKGVFNLRDVGQRDYTDRITEYYNKSIEGKTEGEELYGMVEASMDLVQIISDVLSWRGDNDGYERDYWLTVACYYQHFGN